MAKLTPGREKLLRNWKQRKASILKKETCRYLTNIYKNKSAVLNLSRGKKIKDIRELAPIKEMLREAAAHRCHVFLGDNPDITAVRKEMQKAVHYFSTLIGELKMQTGLAGIIFRSRPRLEVQLEKSIAEVHLDLYATALQVLDEAENYAMPIVKKDVMRIKEKVRKYWDAEFEKWDKEKIRKIDLPEDEKKMLRFAFMYSQDAESSEVKSVEKHIAKKIDFGEKLEALVEKGYITGEEAESARRYLNGISIAQAKKLVDSVKVEKSDGAVIVTLPEMKGKTEFKEFLKEFLGNEKYVTRIKTLSDMLGDDVGQQVVLANPHLLLEDDAVFSKYLSSIGRYIWKNGAGAILTDIETFSHPESLEDFMNMEYGQKSPQENQEAEQAKLYESGFNDNGRHYEFEAVDAIITKGMKLPNFIGECYLPTRYVLNKNLEAYYSEFGDTKENRRKLRQTFLWLVKKGAIMHHHGKGKSVEESTVSINPHINEIKLGVLAEYMREKLGSNRTNGN